MAPGNMSALTVCTNGSHLKENGEEFHLILHFFVVMQLPATGGSTAHTAADKVNKEEQHSLTDSTRVSLSR